MAAVEPKVTEIPGQIPRISNRKFHQHNIFRDNDQNDLPYKVAVLSTQGAMLGTFWSYFDISFLSKPPSWAMTFARAGQVIFPVAATGFLYGSALGITAKIRKKNDVWNHIAAGFAAGTVRGMYDGISGMSLESISEGGAYDGVRLGALLALGGMVLKEFALKDTWMIEYNPKMRQKTLPFAEGTFFVQKSK